ncbi:ubiquitin carboxyl-terminal hydrolase 4 isoform X4 [Accipiter gentilis]|uniref:ubiquitin carboxyl-terminal hydrolase 4 isoform X4 n=1 Tax=Astur gentilis TaxID=8957 RepID=UPI0021102A83|nr:ubiquitin carboxyl-terminal hydrolase 4 isoform X4 [Accipiter gentilis]
MAAAEGGGVRPDATAQRAELGPLLATALRPGESWYLVDSRWFKQWKKYVGFDSWDMFGAGDPGLFPGPIDNSGLFGDPETQSLKEHLIDELDYVLVPTEAWNKLVKWYGCIDGQQPIVRKVVEYGLFVKHYKVEVYLLELKLCESSDPDNVISCHFSKADTVATIEKKMRKLFNIPAEKETRLWNRYMSNTYEQLSKLDSTVQDAGLYDGQVVLIEVKNEDGTWPGQHFLAKSCLGLQKTSFKNTTQRSAPRLDSHGWHGIWENMGRYLENFSPPVVWNFTPEQLQNPHEVVEYLKGKCCGYSKEAQLTTLCWALASIYQTLLNVMQHPQRAGRENRLTGTAAIPTLMKSTVGTQTLSTGTVATQTPAPGTAAEPENQSTVGTQTLSTGTVATQTPAPGTAAEPENQTVPVSVATVQKKKYTKKSAHLVRDESEPGSSREQEEEAEPKIITRSLSPSELRDIQKDFSRHPGEHIVTWLLRCWDSGASSLELEGREAKQLGSLSREWDIDKAIGEKTQALSLWRRLLLGVKERYPFKEDITCHPDPDEVQCTQPMWRKFLRSAPPLYANSLAIVSWKEGEGQTVDEVAGRLQQYEGSISSSLRACISAVEKLPDMLAEKLSREFQRFEGKFCPAPVQAPISAIRSRHSSAEEKGYRRYTPRSTLWFYLRDHGEDMREWDGKPTSTLEARVSELQGKTITKGDSSWKNAAPVASRQFPRQSGRADLISDPLEGTSDSCLQKVCNEYYD